MMAPSASARAEGTLLGRYSEAGDTAVEGNAVGLHSLARAARAERAFIKLSTPGDGPEPYDGFLQEVSVEPGEGKIRITRDGSRLFIRGGLEAKALLADNVELLADADPESGGHLHIDYHPDHFYLDATSEPLVIERITP